MRAVIVEGLSALATPVNRLLPDPDNARRGDSEAVARSLNVFGQRKPIVVRKTGEDADGLPTGVVVAGNHTLAAAVSLGWDHVAAVFVDDDASTARGYALADNRTGDLATWDFEQLAQNLKTLQAEDFDLDSLGWAEHELEGLLAAEWNPGGSGDVSDFDAESEGQRRKLAMSAEAWVIVDDAIRTARERSGAEMSEEEAVVTVCRAFLGGEH